MKAPEALVGIPSQVGDDGEANGAHGAGSPPAA